MSHATTGTTGRIATTSASSTLVADQHLPVWAGVVPLTLVPGEPLQDPTQQSSADETLQALEAPAVLPR